MRNHCRGLVLLCILNGCSTSGPSGSSTVYRDEMRSFVESISIWAKTEAPGFLILPQNGSELFTADGEPGGQPVSQYLDAIDGTGREDLFFGALSDDTQTPPSETLWMSAFLDIGEAHGISALVTDYCSTTWKVDSSYSWNADAGYISFAADHRALDNIPAYPVEPFNVSSDDILSLATARNFLYLINPAGYPSKDSLLTALAQTDYDVLIIDLFFEEEQITSPELSSLRVKSNGGSRLVLAYMSIGEAEDYRYYWQPGWFKDPPGWMGAENPEWEGNYAVEYWNSDWQDIIFGSADSYLGRILATGFDGVYLDKIDAFEYWEQ
jgi:cysteinyl-tRNA synthetase